MSLTICRAIVELHERPPMEPKISLDGFSYISVWRIASQCWQDNPADRPSLVVVLEQLKGGSVHPRAGHVTVKIRNKPFRTEPSQAKDYEDLAPRLEKVGNSFERYGGFAEVWKGKLDGKELV